MADEATVKFEVPGSLEQVFAEAMRKAEKRGFTAIKHVELSVDLMEKSDGERLSPGFWSVEISGWLATNEEEG